MNLGNLCIYHGLRLLSFLFRLLPEQGAKALGNLLGRLFMRLIKRRRQVCRANLRRAGFDESLAVEVFQNLGRVLVTFLRMRGADPEVVRRNVDVVGFENYQRARERADSVILVSAHLGNWEKMSWVHASLSGRRSRVVVRPADQPGVDRFLEEVRSMGGYEVLDKRRGIRAIIKELKKGIDLGVMIDQKVEPSMGVPAPFFGEMLPVLPVVSVLVRATGAAIIPVFIGAEQDGRETIHYLPEVMPSGDEVEDTVTLTRLSEDYIRRYPDQWYWVHNRWRHATPMTETVSPADQTKPASQ